MTSGRSDAPTALVDRLAAKFTIGTVVRGLLVSWAAFGVVWTVFGLAVTGRGFTGPAAHLAKQVEATRAVVVVLGLFSLVLGALWVIRTWSILPSALEIGGERRRQTPSGRPKRSAGHGWALLAMAVSATFGRIGEPDITGMYWVAAVTGMWAVMAIVRSVAGVERHNGQASIGLIGPVGLVVGMVGYQMTFGWLHLLAQPGWSGWVMAVEGAALAAGSVLAARVVPNYELVVTPDVEVVAPVELDSAVDGELVDEPVEIPVDVDMSVNDDGSGGVSGLSPAPVRP